MRPFKLTPAFQDYLWGGEKIKTQFNKKTDLDIVAESWELSAHPDGESEIADGELKGMKLSKFAEEYPELLGKKAQQYDKFPIMIKLIDAKGTLSIQVHPGDEYAQRVEGESGKTEMWYILEAEPGASLYYGFQHEITKNELRRRIETDSITDILNRVEVKKGDVIYIPAGTVHAIGAGLLLAEIQQSSNATYRVYDFGRLGADGKPRELHIEKALDVASLKPALLQAPGGGKSEAHNGFCIRRLAECPIFCVDCVELDGKYEGRMDGESFVSLLCVDGEAELLCAGSKKPIAKGDSIFIPADNDGYTLNGEATVLITTL